MKDFTDDRADRAREMNEQGARYYEQGDFAAAIAAIAEAISLDPSEWGFYFNRGRAYDDQGNFRLAIADYTESIRLNPKHPWSYRRRGLARSIREDLDGALADFTADLRLQPNVYSYTERGYVYLRKREPGKALADFNKALQ